MTMIPGVRLNIVVCVLSLSLSPGTTSPKGRITKSNTMSTATGRSMLGQAPVNNRRWEGGGRRFLGKKCENPNFPLPSCQVGVRDVQVVDVDGQGQPGRRGGRSEVSAKKKSNVATFFPPPPKCGVTKE